MSVNSVNKRFARFVRMAGAINSAARDFLEKIDPALGPLRRLGAKFSVVTGEGRLVLMLAVAATILGWLYGWIELAVIGTSACCVLILAVLVTLGKMHYTANIEVDTTRVQVGDHLLGRLHLVNQGKRGLTGTVIELPVGRGTASFGVPALGHGETFNEVFSVPTIRRCVIPIGPVRSVKSDPLNCIRRVHNWSKVLEVFVHPRTVLLEGDPTGLLRDVEGVITRDLSSSDIAFHALRDYIPGDDRRAVHWRSTARTGRLIVRQFEETRKTHLLVVLTLNPDEYASETEFELAISAAASLMLQAGREGREASLVTQDGFVRGISPALLLDEFSRMEASPPGAQRLVSMTADAVAKTRGVTVACLVGGSVIKADELQLANSRIPAEIHRFAIRCNESEGTSLRRISAMTVFGIATLADLPRAMRGAR